MTVPRGQIVASSTCAPCHGLDYRGDSTGATGAPDLWLITQYAPDEVELLLGAGVTAAGDSVDAEMRESVVRALAPDDRTAVYDYLRTYLRASVLEPTR
jgi:mono/diheme cytochrome c family protein